MPWRLEREAAKLGERIEMGDPLWPAQLSLATVIVLNLFLSKRLTIGPTWLMPGVAGGALLVLLVVAPRRATHHATRRRRFALAVISLVSLTNVVSLVLLVHYLVNGGKSGGHALILSGLVLWASNVLLFAVWFWELDRGGPVNRFQHAETLPDFQFPQMENPNLAPKDWEPFFVDYLYLSFTNALAFSPTDVMPLSRWAKLTMLAQSGVSVLLVLLVIARAVNILK